MVPGSSYIVSIEPASILSLTKIGISHKKIGISHKK
jgi:hypothetical protein